MSINNLSSFTKARVGLCVESDSIDNNLYEEYGVKRGLRDLNGIGINAGITNISLSRAYKPDSDKLIPIDGELYYRGYEIRQLIDGFMSENRYGFEECTYLLLFGKLPDADELSQFKQVLNLAYDLPHNFIQDVIMKNPTKDIISNMTKSILALGSYDKSETDISLDNVLQQCLMIISVFPRLAVYSFQGYRHYELGKSCYIHKPDPKLSFAENILSMLRSDRKYTQLEARVLDLALVLHMEHGGGSNSKRRRLGQLWRAQGRRRRYRCHRAVPDLCQSKKNGGNQDRYRRRRRRRQGDKARAGTAGRRSGDQFCPAADDFAGGGGRVPGRRL